MLPMPASCRYSPSFSRVGLLRPNFLAPIRESRNSPLLANNSMKLQLHFFLDKGIFSGMIYSNFDNKRRKEARVSWTKNSFPLSLR